MAGALSTPVALLLLVSTLSLQHQQSHHCQQALAYMCDRDSLSHEAQANGSMLLASSAEEVAALEVRAAALQTQGVAARGLSAQQVARLEPAVRLPGDGGGLLVASDSQLVRKGVEFWMHAYYFLNASSSTALLRRHLVSSRRCVAGNGLTHSGAPQLE